MSTLHPILVPAFDAFHQTLHHEHIQESREADRILKDEIFFSLFPLVARAALS
jgi:hypothetical protein